MAKEIKAFLRDERRVGKLLASILLLVITGVVAGQGVLAYFYRTDLPSTGWHYGYGYGSGGYGYGYGYGESQTSYWNYGYLLSERTPSAAVSAGQTSATFNITTNYPALVKVSYGLSSGSYSVTGSYTASRATSASVGVNGLTCDTTYYYQVTAKDIGGINQWPSTESTFRTTACSGGSTGGGGTPTTPITPTTPTTPATPTETTQSIVSPTASGEVTLIASDGSKIEVTVPAGAVEETTTFNVTRSDSATAVSEGNVGSAPSTLIMVGDAVYELTASDASGNAVNSFNKDLTLTFTYTDEQIEGLDEEDLQVYMWDGTKWVALDSVVNTENNTIYAYTDHFTYFAIMAKEEEEEKPISEMTIEELKEKIKELAALIVSLQAKIRALIGVFEGVPSGFRFSANLQQGASSDEVKYLQIALNSSEDTKVASSGAGSPGSETSYFGPLTRAAVIKFQEKYASEVLAYWGLTSGTGFVGKTTIEKLNDLLSSW